VTQAKSKSFHYVDGKLKWDYKDRNAYFGVFTAKGALQPAPAAPAGAAAAAPAAKPAAAMPGAVKPAAAAMPAAKPAAAAMPAAKPAAAPAMQPAAPAKK
jgi:hypothetical protein